MDTSAQEPNNVRIEDLIAYQDGVGKALDAHDVSLLKQVLKTTKHIHHPAYKDPWTSLINRGYSTEKTMIPLVQAVKHGDSVMAEILLQAGAADVNMADDDPANPKYPFTDKLTPLVFAAAAGDLPMCRMLHSYGADVNATVARQGVFTALHAAARHQHLHIADWLFKHGARLLQNDECSATRIAAVLNNPRLVELFVDQYEQSYPGSQLQITTDRTLYTRAEGSALVLLFHGHHLFAKICNQDCKPMSKASCKRCFRVACFLGFTNILRTMISYNPQLLQENYLGRSVRPGCSCHHKEYIATLVEQRKQPVSLQRLCKGAILCRVGGKSAEIINKKIKQLLLPNILKSFLQLYDPCKGK